MIKRGVTILFLFCCLNAELRQAAVFEAMSFGADSMGRGGTYLTNTGSNHYIFQNYSFLGQKPGPRLSLTAVNLLTDVNFFAAAYSQNNFSIGILRMQESGGDIRDSADNFEGGQINYSDTTIYGAYGLALGTNLLGLRARVQTKYFSGVDVTAQGLALDIAGARQLSPYLTVGGQLNNILSTDLQWSNGLSEPFGRSLGLGSRFKLCGPDGYFSEHQQPIDIYADVLAAAEMDSFYNVGAEYWPCDSIVLRGGLKQVRDVQNERGAKFTKLTAGLGFNYANFYIDYAYNPGDNTEGTVAHFLTIAYRWAEQEVTPKKFKQTFYPTLDNTSL